MSVSSSSTRRTTAYAYKVQYFDGAAAGHATTVNPGRTVGFLGNAGQHLLFYDAATLEEVDRVSTLQFEVNDTTLRGSTHLVWLDDSEFITAGRRLLVPLRPEPAGQG